jgi:hypothetical protein
MDVVKNQRSVLCKKYNQLVFRNFIAFFKLPKVLLTIGMTFLLVLILKHSFYNEIIFIGFCIILIGFAFYEIIKIVQTESIRRKQCKRNGFLKRL